MKGRIVLIISLSLIIVPQGYASQLSAELSKLTYSSELGIDLDTDYFWWDVGTFENFTFNPVVNPLRTELTSNSHVELRISPPFNNIIEIAIRSSNFELSVDDSVVEFTSGEYDFPNMLLDLLVTPTEGETLNGELLSGFALVDYYFLPKFATNFAITFQNQLGEQTSIDAQWNDDQSLIALELYNSTQYHFISFTDYGLITQYYQAFRLDVETVEGFSLVLRDDTERRFDSYFFDFYPDVSKMFNWDYIPGEEITTITSTGDPFTSTGAEDWVTTSTGIPVRSAPFPTLTGQLGLNGIVPLMVVSFIVLVNFIKFRSRNIK